MSMRNDMGIKFDLDKMTVDEMWTLHGQLCRALAGRLTQEKRELERRLAQLNREQLVTPSDAFAVPNLTGAPQRRRYPRVYPKYRNPNAPNETWSGRGKQPRWLTAALEAGHTIEEYAIAPDERANDDSREHRPSKQHGGQLKDL